MQSALASLFSGRLSRFIAPVLDYALPPRCSACGEIVETVGSFCAPCWNGLDFIAEPLCACCGLPLPDLAEEGTLCGACLSSPPPFARARAITRFDGPSRQLVHGLKYGRRTGHARTMARQMARFLPDDAPDAILVPVPLHRWRIWSRGFNQAALMTRWLTRETGLAFELDLIERTRRTPPLHALGRRARERAVEGAFAVRKGMEAQVQGRHFILVDDVWTTGSTATGCAKVLVAAGAARVDIICWARALLDRPD